MHNTCGIVNCAASLLAFLCITALTTKCKKRKIRFAQQNPEVIEQDMKQHTMNIDHCIHGQFNEMLNVKNIVFAPLRVEHCISYPKLVNLTATNKELV